MAASKTVKIVATLLILVGILSLVMGSLFISESFAKSNMITDAMYEEGITYGGGNGEIEGVIDNAYEAQVMASVLKEHRLDIGIYSELARDDPGRETILKAMTMENSLNLAQMGYGLTDVVKYTGLFMIVIGVTISVCGGTLLFSGRRSRQ